MLASTVLMPEAPSRAEDRAKSNSPSNEENGALPDDDSPMATRGISTTTSRAQTSPMGESHPTSPRSGHQKLVFTDPVAFRYLEEDPSTVVLDRRRRLEGYELYIVEQWACSRVHPTFIIATFTGDPTHSILVSVLSVPTDESNWSSRLRVYFKAVSQFHARRKDTSMGTLMVTNLSGFPSALTVIAVPDGDVKKHREDFIVNENLKRLNCSGRAGLNLQPPAPATQAKFHQLYRTSDRIPLYSSVIELVKLCQFALSIFGKLAPEYADGLLCDITEKAINDWWTDIGTDFFNVEPSDGILGPTTVSALLGMLIGARNRLNAYGAPVGKDVFDIPNMKRGIANFQKSQKLERTRRLDRQTLDKLQRVTAKAASGDGWTVPRAVKSTVAELGGKGGEMVMGMVGGREKAGIAEIETLDIERFVQLVHGERLKWLWHGKPRKSGVGDVFSNLAGEDDMIFSRDDQGGYVWTSQKRDSVAESLAGRTGNNDCDSFGQHTGSSTHLDDKDLQSKVLKSVTGRVSDARSGFGRLKDAVGIPGLRSHNHKHSKEDGGFDLDGDMPYQGTFESEVALTTVKPTREPSPSPETQEKPAKALEQPFQHSADDLNRRISSDASRSDTRLEPEPRSQSLDKDDDPNTIPYRHETEDRSHEQSLSSRRVSKQGLDVSKDKFDEFISDMDQTSRPMAPFLRHTRSSSDFKELQSRAIRENRWPRHLSFSAVEDTVLTWEDVGPKRDDHSTANENPAVAMRQEAALAAGNKNAGSRILYLRQVTVPWVESQVDAVDEFDQQGQRHQEELNALYYPRLEDYQMLRSTSTDLLGEEKLSLTDALKGVEVLGAKLDYELNALQSKVEDVEDGIAEFERHILEIESRVDLLVDQEHGKDSWVPWCARLLGIKKQ